MKRGLLNTPRSKRSIEEAYAPRSPLASEPRRTQRLTASESPPLNHPAQEEVAPPNDGASTDSKEAPVAEEVYAEGRVVPSVEPKERKPLLPVPFTQNGGDKVPPRVDEGRPEPEVEEVCANGGPVGKCSTDSEKKKQQYLVPGETYTDGQIVVVRLVPPTEYEAKSRLRDGNNAETELPSATKDTKVEGKANVVDANDTPTNPTRPYPLNPRGWGRHPVEDFYHTIPKSWHVGVHKKRDVFCHWPRDPNGTSLPPSDLLVGTLSPDGYPWCATLYDVYRVNRVPSVPDVVSIMTGSAICKGLKRMEELDAAASQIEWAKSEGVPRVMGAADTEELILSVDTAIRFMSVFPGSPASSTQDVDDDEPSDEGSDKDSASEREEGDGCHDATELVHASGPPAIPITSPFHPSHYPKPWPLTPFEHTLPILLQETIPLYLLPQTLYVHDPFDLLPACERSFENTSWTSRPDVVRTYDLISHVMRHEVEEARQEAEELEDFKARTLIVLRYKRTEEHAPVIEVPLPPYPRRTTRTEESHLYLSPAAKVGTGNHSIVYKGEWELPRDIFQKPRICQQCFEESVDKEIQRLKDTGKWKAASWGPNGLTGRFSTQAESDDIKEPTKPKTDGEVIEREIICFVPPRANPSIVIKKVHESDTWDMLTKHRHMKRAELRFAKVEEEDEECAAVIRIDPCFTYESQTNCPHELRPSVQGPVSAPRTANFTVVAKLSLEDDPHLAREARNYQMFPEHFFHHYNGYTIVDELHAIVPVNAVVPQFYGYYLPRDGESSGQISYLSPILLIEHCGKPIKPEKLSVEDQEECASLLLRFQRAGWIHESVAQRNFVVQRGKPTNFPFTRLSKPELSFRLIDFGRSRRYACARERRAEERETAEMFRKVGDTMRLTLDL